MIGRLLPHPLLVLVLAGMWMVLTRFSLGNLLLGMGIAIFAGWAMHALQPERVPMRSLRVMPRLVGTLFVDIIRSNVMVARLLLTEGRGRRTSAFLLIPVKLRSPTGLAVLAIILTATPGTAWVEYVSETGTLVLHVFHGAESAHYLHVVNNVYGPMLQEIFE
ncbi:Na+/H+ antiporter subunit E [Paracoccus beibuensis]|uniref:Na+/H+ antiporter subunit E n=1 Tax=Paracoccus beibuensis TaxID=547602 RepID=UPI0022407300|nr:Na+/H+ antiporter subunit E [Paracoccus beibuensis]